MAGEFVMLNPRRRRRRRTTRARSHARKPVRRRRRRTVRARVHHNPTRRLRRRRRASAHRRTRRRVHRNPRFNMAGIDIGSAVFVGAGLVGSDIAAGYVLKMLPGNWQSAPARLAVKAAIGIGTPLLLRRFIGTKNSNLLALGAFAGVVVDAYHLWVAPMIGLSGYETGMTGYEPGIGAGEGGDAGFAGGENMYSDTMY